MQQIKEHSTDILATYHTVAFINSPEADGAL